VAQKQKKGDKRKKESVKQDGGQSKKGNKGKRIKEDVDKLLDKIDEVLEENAEEFVKNYVQKGGQ